MPADDAVLKPEHLWHEAGSTLPIAAVTAWSALMKSDIKGGDWVLVEGTGGVSIFALQFAKAMGARVVAITSSADKIARLKNLGADAAINYREMPQWAAAVRTATGGRGADIVIETAGSTFGQALESTAFGGFIGVIGFLGGMETKLPLVPLIEQMLKVEGIVVGSREQFEAMNRAIHAASLTMEAAADAFKLMDRGGHFGKIVLSVG